LPPNFDRNRKQGFSIPLAEWLKKGHFRDLFHSVLLDAESPFDHSYVYGLLRGQDKGRSNSARLFSLVMFELWRREYKVSV
jgi:asparagine synthase (glutamine-hydrolysing)